MRFQFADLSMDIAYNQDKSVVIRRFPTEYEKTKLKKSKYQLVDEEVYTSDNHLELNMYYNTKRKHIDVISGGNWNFKEGGRYGVDIDVKLKKSERDLNEYLCGIIRQLCNKHLRPCILFTSRHTINCQIDECKLTEDTVNSFIEEFIISLEGTIKDFDVIRKEKKIEKEIDEKVRKREEYEDKFVCPDCNKQFDYNKREYWYDEKSGNTLQVCSDCWSMRKKTIRDLESNKKEEKEFLCEDCGERYPYKDREYFYDKKFKDKVMICKDCWKDRRKGKRKKLPKDKEEVNEGRFDRTAKIEIAVAFIVFLSWFFGFLYDKYVESSFLTYTLTSPTWTLIAFVSVIFIIYKLIRAWL